MEFDYNKVYTAANADKLEIGSKVYVAKNLRALREQVCEQQNTLCILTNIRSEEFQDRFVTKFVSDGTMIMSTLVYLVSEPEKKKLEWTDLKVGDVITLGDTTAMITQIDKDSGRHILAGYKWLTDKELTEWEKVEEDNG